MKSKNLLCVLAALTIIFISSNCWAKNNKNPKQGEVTMKEKTNSLKAFPAIQAKNLEGKQVAIPDDAKGKVTLVALAFLRQSQGQLDSWLNPFYEKFGKRDDFMFYEIPMISGKYVFIKPIIDNGMRGGLPQFKHKHVVTFFGDVNKYSKILNVDPKFGHVFLLDKEGMIHWQNKGSSEKDALEEMFGLAEKLSN